jgi:dipeptidyl aminopeptidase/acylaminoacyl peptidase
MNRASSLIILLFVTVSFSAFGAEPFREAAKPAALVADGIPPVPAALVEATRPYMEFRAATFLDWNVRDRSMLIATRFGNVAQLHTVSGPLMARRQISFEAEPIAGYFAPNDGTLVVRKDNGGNEFYQLYTLSDGRLTLLTDGQSRNNFNTFSPDGRWLAYSSTRRNGTATDLYLIDPRSASTDRMVLQVESAGWSVLDITADNARALVAEYHSIEKTDLFMLDIDSGKLTSIGDHSKRIAYGNGRFAQDGTLWVTSDEDSDFIRLGTLDLVSGEFTVRSPESQWDVIGFTIAPDNSYIAYVVNEAGVSRLRLLDPVSFVVRDVNLPNGVITGLKAAPWGTLGLSMTSARVPNDAYSVDPETLVITRWTESETGGLDASRNVEPEFVEVQSFDGEIVSGFLYRPDPTKFPGKRPLIVNIHGGPESSFTPGFLGRTNYLLSELGIAVFYPNVRGSTGFGKRFVSLDNGPFLRENSVLDIGAFLDLLQTDTALDAERTAVLGGSYGGYMCYASALRYAARLKAANCIVAISNFVTFLENTQSYRRDLRRVEYGDERDADQRAKLLEI